MKNRVDGLEVLRELGGEEDRAYLGNNLKGAYNFSERFFEGQVVQMLLDQMKTLSPILKSRGEVVFLGFKDCFLEFLVKFIKVYYKVSSSFGCKVSLGVYGDVGVISLVGKERKYTSGGIRSIVICELCDT